MMDNSISQEGKFFLFDTDFKDTNDSSSSKSSENSPNEIKTNKKNYLPDKYFIVKTFLTIGITIMFIILVIFTIMLYIVFQMINKYIINLIPIIGIVEIIKTVIELYSFFSSDCEKNIKTFFDTQKYKIKSNKIKIAACIILPICFTSYVGYQIPTVNAYAQELLENSANFIIDSLPKNSNSNNISIEAVTNNANNNTSAYFSDIEFIITNEDKNATDSMNSKVFAITSPNETMHYLKNLYNSSTPTYNEYCFSSNIQDVENNFYDKLNNAKYYAKRNGKNPDWYDMLPKEEMLLAAINDEETFARTHKNYFVYNRLSNNYQKLALEYINQDASKNTAKYYYMKSIEYDLLSIQYTNNTFEFYTSVERIYNRYRDIRDNCCDIGSYEYKILKMYIEDIEEYL